MHVVGEIMELDGSFARRWICFQLRDGILCGHSTGACDMVTDLQSNLYIL